MKKYPVTKPFFSNEENEYIAATLDSGWVAQGFKVAEFEKAVAEHEQVAKGIATTSCTTALHLAMAAQGMRGGHDVIAPAFTFVATENAIVETGATPVLVDIERNTFNIDVGEVERIIDSKYVMREGHLRNRETGNVLWGVVPVHEFGLCCDIHKINQIAECYNLQIIEDAACALGSKIGDIHQGGFGNTSCVSFHPRKSITTGEGGMVLTNDLNLARRLKELRSHGNSISAESREEKNGFLLPEYNEAGFNYRMTDIQGAMGMAQVKKLDYIIEEKRKSAAAYNDLISSLLPELDCPIEPEGFFHTYQSYVCKLNEKKMRFSSIKEGGNFRNKLMQNLENRGIATRQGTHAVHMLGYYQKRFAYKPDDFLNAYACDHLSIALPLYVGISQEDMEYIVHSIRREMDNV